MDISVAALSFKVFNGLCKKERLEKNETSCFSALKTDAIILHCIGIDVWVFIPICSMYAYRHSHK